MCIIHRKTRFTRTTDGAVKRGDERTREREKNCAWKRDADERKKVFRLVISFVNFYSHAFPVPLTRSTHNMFGTKVAAGNLVKDVFCRFLHNTYIVHMNETRNKNGARGGIGISRWQHTMASELFSSRIEMDGLGRKIKKWLNKIFEWNNALYGFLRRLPFYYVSGFKR